MESKWDLLRKEEERQKWEREKQSIAKNIQENNAWYRLTMKRKKSNKIAEKRNEAAY